MKVGAMRFTRKGGLGWDGVEGEGDGEARMEVECRSDLNSPLAPNFEAL